jgi:hypothetical protein
VHTYIPTYLPTYIHTYIHTYIKTTRTFAGTDLHIHTHTHTCRYADAGHYVCYVQTGMGARKGKTKAAETVWMKFDDDKVSWVLENEVKA